MNKANRVSAYWVADWATKKKSKGRNTRMIIPYNSPQTIRTEEYKTSKILSIMKYANNIGTIKEGKPMLFHMIAIHEGNING
jgi:hypothetical protein